MGMRYYQRVGRGSGVSMPVWMLPFWLLVMLFVYVCVAIAAVVMWLLYQLLRALGLGGAAALRSARAKRVQAAADAKNPEIIAAREQERRQRATLKAGAHEAFPNLLPSSWLVRLIAAAWSILWIGAGIGDLHTALTTSGHSLVGPILGPAIVILVTVVAPLAIVRAVRRHRWMTRHLHSEVTSASAIASSTTPTCTSCGEPVSTSAKFCGACGSAVVASP